MNALKTAIAGALAILLLGAGTPAPPPARVPAAAPARPAPPAGAEAFVRGIYAHYPAPEGGPYFNPTEAPQAARLFDASLLALLRRAQAASHDEVVSGLDADYFCSCQDDGGIRWRFVSVTATDATHATASVSITWDAADSAATMVRLLLVSTPQGWRIHDITSGGGSWRADLTQGIREAGGGR